MNSEMNDDRQPVPRRVEELPDLLTVTELASYLQVSKKTIYHWRSLGQGPAALLVGKHIRFRKETVNAWLESTEEA